MSTRPIIGNTLFVLTLCLMINTNPVVWAASGSDPAYVPNEVILKFKPAAKADDVTSLLTEMGASKIREFQRIKASHLKLANLSVKDAISRYKDYPLIAYIEPNYLISLDGIPNDPLFPELWGMSNSGQTGGTPGADISAVAAWDIQTNAEEVIVAVIDSGVDYNHEDLSANIYVNPNEIPDNGFDDDGNGFVDDVHGWNFAWDSNDPMDTQGHGTAVAGILGAVGNNLLGVTGVAWNVKILPLKYTIGNVGQLSDALAAVEYATMMGVHIMNNSWGENYAIPPASMVDAFTDASNAGILLVCAAGNGTNNNDNLGHFPATLDLPLVLSVAASDADDLMPNFSNYGLETVDLAAPGMSIFSTLPSGYGLYGDPPFIPGSGTSFAAPHVAGALALTQAYLPSLTPLELKNRLLATVDPLPAFSGVVATGGRLNLRQLLIGPDVIPPAAVTDLAVVEAASDWVTLTWTATGDDSSSGTAAAYDLRYATFPIDSLNFEVATAAVGLPVPAPAGESEQALVFDLDYDTGYHFALKVIDERGNVSAISNVVQATTLGPPEISVAPDSFLVSLITNASTTRTLTIYNQGVGILNYHVALDDVTWLAAEPDSGLVTAGDSTVVTITVDATGLCEPTYAEFIPIQSNDPALPELLVPILLEVTSIPSLSVSIESLDFGEVFIGWPVTDTLTVTNAGCGTLTISDISSDLVEFVVTPNSFDLGPAASQEVQVVFDPTAATLYAGTLTITSNDPTDPVLALPLTGQGLVAPEISVNPDSLFTVVTLEEPSTQLVTIQNDGGSDLAWRMEATQARQSDLSGVIILWDRSHGQSDLSQRYALVSTLTDRGAAVTENFSFITTSLLELFDVLWIGSSESNWAPEELTAISYWVRAGGGLILEGGSTSTLAFFNDLLDSIDAGISFEIGFCANGLTTNIHQHPTTENVNEIFVISSNTILANISFPATPLIDDWTGTPITASSSIGAGRVVVLSALINYDDAINLADNMLFANQVFDWLALGVNWLAVSPEAGTVAAGGLTEVAVTFSAPLGVGGDFLADLYVLSNDPANSEIRLPTHMRLECYGNIAVSDTLIDFGPVWMGETETGTLVVSNIGCELLSVSSVTCDHPDFTVTPYSFDLPVGEGQDLTLEFSPGTVLSITSQLNIQSNDPDDPLITVTLTGFGLNNDPPEIFVTPDSLRVDLISEQTEVQDLTIANQGPGYLAWEISSVLPTWLLVEPISGLIYPDSSETVSVIFDASGYCDGDYIADIAFTTNDPINPEVIVATHMYVTGVPNISLSDTTIAFGSVFVGASEVDTLLVTNTGCGLLNVTEISWTHNDIYVTPTDFTLSEDESQTVLVSFSPSTVSVVVDTLTIYSDDPDTSVNLLPLSGEGIPAPVVEVSTDSLYATLFSGEVGQQAVTLSNSGGNDLLWQILPATASGFDLFELSSPNPAAQPHDGSKSMLPKGLPAPEPLTALLADLDGVQILWDRAHGESAPSDWSTVIADLTFRGATITENHLPVTTELLLAHDILWITDCLDTWTEAEIAAIAQWIGWSGRLLLAGDNDSSVATYNRILSATGIGMSFSTTDGAAGVTSSVYPHVTTAGVTSLLLDSPVGSLVQITAPASVLVADVNGAANTAYWVDTASKIVAMADENFSDFAVWHAGNQLFANQVIDWLADRSFWLAAMPDTGVVPPDSTIAITVTFDATNVCSGEFLADLAVLSNDPLTPEYRIATQLDVAGEPNITVSHSLLSFETLYIGQVATDSFSITNSGCDLLTVVSISSDHGDFSVSPESFELPVGASQNVWVSFSPTSEGVITATLTITSNDPDALESTVALEGAGLVAPEISVAPDSLYADLLTGQSEIQTVTITNSGGSDLNWEIGIGDVTLSSVTFTKADYADWTLPENQDRITDNVWITRADFQGIFNAATESGYSYSSPDDTEWAYGLTENLQPEDYQTWRNAVFGYPPGMVGQTISLHLISDDLYFDVEFHSWTPAANGGGFSYTRTAAAPNWLEVSPESGTVPAGGSVGVNVTFNSLSICSGDYLADLWLLNNDPFAPEIRVPTHLHVTGQPDITVSDTLLAFGSLFIGDSVLDTLVVSNTGCDSLVVTSISSDHSDFTVSPENFVLPIGTSQEVLVTFTPTSATQLSAALMIQSNDPDQPSLTVTLEGEGLVPPAISVAPDSLYADLLTGEFATQIVTISNSGGSDLNWESQIVYTGAAGSQLFTLHLPDPTAMVQLGEWGVLEDQGDSNDPDDYRQMAVVDTSSLRQKPLTARLTDLTGTAILWDRSHGQPEMSGWSVLVSDLTSRGATVTENYVPLTSDMLAAFDILISVEGLNNWTVAEGQILTDWVQAGGSLFLNGDNDSAVAANNTILSALGAGIEYSTGNGFSGVTTYIYPHETTAGVTSIYVYSPGARLVAVMPPAGRLVDDNYHYANSAYSEVGTSRIFATAADYIFNDYGITLNSNQLFVNQVFDWLANKVRWLSTTPQNGTVPAGGSQDVAVNFDATEICSIDELADWLISSNDPLAPEVRVATHLHVTGETDIAVSDTLFAFGSLFVGASGTDTLVVSNPGCELLTVTDISIDHDDFTALPTSFDLPSGESQDVLVTFMPTSVAQLAAALTIQSNDPDEPELTIMLEGEGLPAPEISVAPDSLYADLLVGELETQIVTISNSGGSDLIWEVMPTFVGDDSGFEKDPRFGYSTALAENRNDLTSLEEILSSLNENYEAVTDIIPNRYDFFEGETGVYIYDGGDDMYDGGNYLSTNIGGPLMYTNNIIVGSISFGAAGRYFTRKYPGLFVLGADLENVDEFTIFGGLGADGFGFADGAVLTTTHLGQAYQGYVKRVYDAYGGPGGAPNPSVNHLIIIAENPAAMQEFSTNTSDDYHRLMNISDSVRLYYLLYAGSGSYFIDNTATLQIMDAFLGAIGLVPAWLTADPGSGLVVPGGSVDVAVTFDATSICGGDFLADLMILNNDPLVPELSIPTHLHTTGETDIAVSDTLLAFGPVLVGATATDTLVVSNPGCDLLTVTSISSDHGDFTVSPESFDLPFGASQDVLVSFNPTSVTIVTAILTITSNDPDEPELTVTLRGEGLVAPEISVAPDSLYADLIVGQTEAQTILITNSGGSDLNWEIGIEIITGESVTFTKDNYADWTLPENQDRITDNVWITRANAQGIFNAATESSYNYDSPDDTEWAYGLTENLQPEDYQIWRDAVFSFPPGMVGQTISLHLISDDLYYDVEFHSWTSAGSGGGFSYTRTAAVPSWLVLSQESGTVPAGGSVDIDVTFSASELCGGDYLADLWLLNNDPLSPEIRIPAHMHVTGEPDIALSDTTFQFGQVYIGASVIDTLVVSNPGCDLLMVTDISSDHGDFSATPNSFDLPVGESQSVLVTFMPTSAAQLSAMLTIQSNDPDEPIVVVALEGEGLIPPEISVTTDSLFADLLTGETETQIVTIQNSGGSDLNWLSRVESGGSVGTKLYTLNLPDAASVARPDDPDESDDFGQKAALDPGSRQQKPLLARLADLTGTTIMWDLSHYQSSVFSWSVLIADLTIRGATVSENYASITDTLLSEYDILISMEGADSWSAGELSALADWLLAGGSLFLDGDNNSAVAAYNLMLSSVGAGIEFDIVSGYYGTTPNVYPHETTDGVTNIFLGSPGAHLSVVVPPAGRLVDDTNHVANSAYSEVGAGRIFTIADDYIFDDYYITFENNQLFANQVFDWLATGVSWLSVVPEEGTVPAGSSQDVEVTFDATQICGGDYLADLVILNNDPLAPAVRLGTYLHVTGEPDIAVSDTLLAFGTLFLGDSVTDTLVVSNPGCDLLTVTNISSDHTDFTVSPASFDLVVGEDQSVLVSFSPTSAAVMAAALTIESNDPDQPTLTVALTGEGLIPPEISVAPDSLYADLLTGETETQIVTIANSGGSDLIWEAVPIFVGSDFVLAKSPVFGPGLVLTETKAEATTPPPRPTVEQIHMAQIHTVTIAEDRSGSSSKDLPTIQNQPGPATADREILTSLEDILTNLNENYEAISSVIPNRYDFSDGETGTGIIDGGNDMYDGGNYLSTNLGGPLEYSNNMIVGSTVFGVDGRYFTRKYPGLFVLCADLENVDDFEIAGDLGADGSGYVDGVVLATSHAGQSYQGFVKRVYEAYDPSVNHLIIIAENPTATHEFSTSTNDDYHRLMNITGSVRLYYLLYAGSNGYYIDDAATLQIMDAFLGTVGLAPFWLLTADPSSGTVVPGGSVDVSVTLDATEICGGDYLADLLILNNDPLAAEARVATHMHVTGEPDIAISDSLLAFGALFIGDSVTDTLFVSSSGCDLLTVTDISSDHGDFSVTPTSFDLPAGESQSVLVTFTPTSAAQLSAALTIQSNDPDEPIVTVALEGEGLIQPEISVAPDSLFADLLTGETETQIVTIYNNGGSDLNWESLALPSGYFSGSGLAPPSKGKSGHHTFGQTVLGHGGPDAFGYTWQDSDEIGGPTYDWIEINTIGSVVGGGMNANHGPFDLEFPFSFYGSTYSSIRVCTNGWLSFTSESAESVNQGIPELQSPNNLIALFWDDLNVDAGGAIYYYQDIVNSRFIVEWDGVHHYPSGNPETFQVILNADGSIIYQYKTIDTLLNGTSCTVGIENLDGTDGLQVVFNGEYLHNDMAVRFQPALAWLMVNPDQGVVPVGGSMDVQVLFDASDVCGGDLLADVLILNNDPLSPVVQISAHMHVTGTPQISVSDSLLSFGDVALLSISTDSLVVTNVGCSPLTITDVFVDDPVFSVVPAFFVLAAGEHQNVQVSFQPDSLIAYAATMTLASDDPLEPEKTVALTGQGTLPSGIVVDPPSLSIYLTPGLIDTSSVSITNSGQGPLHWEAVVVGSGHASSEPSRFTAGAPLEFAKGAHFKTAATDEPLLQPTYAYDEIDLSGMRILWDRSHGQVSTGNWSEMLTDLGERGAEVVASYDPISAALLSAFEVLVCLESSDTWTAAEETALADWVQAGGSILLNGNENSSIYAFENILSTLNAGLQLSVANAASGVTTNICLHEATDEVLGIDLPSPWARIGMINEPGRCLVRDMNYVHVVASSPVGMGRVVVATDENIFINNSYHNADNERLANQIFNWFAKAPSWLSVLPESGSVLPGETSELSVIFNTTRLCGTVSLGSVLLSSNDPLSPVTTIDVTMNVSAAPTIVASDTFFVFESVHVGEISSLTMSVANIGCDTLTVTDFVSSTPEFSVGNQGFFLAPQWRRSLNLVFIPSSPGVITGTISFISNDPVNPALVLSVQGEGLDAPLISLNPNALSVLLPVGENTTRTVDLENQGGEELTFEFNTPTKSSLAPPAPIGGEGERRHDDTQLRGLPVPSGQKGTGTNTYNLRNVKKTSERGSSQINAQSPVQPIVGSVTNIVFFDNIESGMGSWTTIVDYGGDLWHPTQRDYNSPVTSMWCGNESSGNYNIGSRVRTTLVSPYIDLTQISVWDEVFLGFFEKYDTEPGWDLCSVSIHNGNYWSQIRGPVGGHSYGWLYTLLDISSYIGHVVRIGFFFDTNNGNNNDFPGWFVDDIIVTNTIGEWLDISPLSGVVPPYGHVDVMFQIVTNDMLAGQYYTNVRIETNDPVHPEIVYPVSLSLIDAPVHSRIDLVAGNLTHLENRLGTSTGASDGYDLYFDLVAAEPDTLGYLSGYFPHPEWGVPEGEKFWYDFRAPYDPLLTSQIWSFVVDTDQIGEVNLVFSPGFSEDSGWEFWLLDLETGIDNQLFPSLSYSYDHTASGPRYFEIRVGRTEPPQLQPPARVIVPEWAMLGYPLLPLDANATLADVILAGAPDPVFLYRYDTETGYQLCDPVDPVLIGEGLWLATTESFTWSMEGWRDLDGTAVSLQNGWNLLGYPLWFPGELAGVQVDAGGERHDFWDAVDLGLISAGVFGFETSLGDFVSVDSLRAWHGYWVAGLQDSLALWFEFGNFGIANPLLLAAKQEKDALPDQWRVAVTLNAGGGQTAAASFGMDPAATLEFDARFDLPEPPNSPAGAKAQLVFLHPEWQLPIGNAFRTDIIGPSEPPLLWEAQVLLPEPGSATLAWDSSEWMEGLDFQVYRPDLNQVVVSSMREQASVVLDVGENGLPLQFRSPDHSTETSDAAILAYRLACYPNPFNPMTTLFFDWPQAGRADLHIYDVRGMLVKRFRLGELPVGHHRVVWQGRDENGRGVASGIYFAVLHANGQRVGQIQKMSLVR